MVYALDTNTVAYYMRREGGVVARLQTLSPHRLALPSVVVFEGPVRAVAPRDAVRVGGVRGADLLIAATARSHGCTLVTHNTREFSRVPDLQVEDWY